MYEYHWYKSCFLHESRLNVPLPVGPGCTSNMYTPLLSNSVIDKYGEIRWIIPLKQPELLVDILIGETKNERDLGDNCLDRDQHVIS